MLNARVSATGKATRRGLYEDEYVRGQEREQLQCTHSTASNGRPQKRLHPNDETHGEERDPRLAPEKSEYAAIADQLGSTPLRGRKKSGVQHERQHDLVDGDRQDEKVPRELALGGDQFSIRAHARADEQNEGKDQRREQQVSQRHGLEQRRAGDFRNFRAHERRRVADRADEEVRAMSAATGTGLWLGRLWRSCEGFRAGSCARDLVEPTKATKISLSEGVLISSSCAFIAVHSRAASLESPRK